jgi:transposase
MEQGAQTEVEDVEEILARVAAIDVAKATGMVCTRVPHESRPGRRITKTWSVAATTRSIIELADHLACQGVERVVVESTSDYWRPFYYLLEARGLTVWLVNARQVKNVPGRPKTDKLDAVWLAKLNERGMLRPSFVPPAQIRRLRDYTRLRLDLTEERSRHKQRMEKLLEDALIKLSIVATDIFGVSGRQMIEAMIAGERDPRVLAELAKGRMRSKRPALIAALDGRFDDHHADLAQMILDQVDVLTRQIDRLTLRIEELITATDNACDAGTGDQYGDDTGPGQAASPLPVLDRLDEIPGIGRHGAQIIVAEVGLDMSRFTTAGHLVSWAKLCPATIQSGTRNKAGKSGKGNRYLKGLLGEAAAAAAKTDTFLGERYRRLIKRMPKGKALVALARSILTIIWHLLSDPAARYTDLGADFHTRRIDTGRKTRSLIHQLEALGHKVTLTPAEAA